MTNLLIVPIYLDALALDRPTAVMEAFANFSRLPYFDGERDVNPDVPNLSEEILSQPFQNQNLFLESGVHLHWALPDALTRGSQGADGKTEFPAVPNRWLVTRLRNNNKEAQWVIESDYLYDPRSLPSDSPIPGQTVSYPYPDDPNCPFRYLGKVTNANSWAAGQEDTKNYLEKLTAVGYGEPAFAAFYPNCFSVFGFHDNSAGPDLNALAYEVIGWYSKGKPYDASLPFIASSWQFQSGDILNWERLASLLIKSGNNKNPAIGQIYNLLNANTKTLLSRSEQTLQRKDQEQILNDFNNILTKKELYQKEAFKDLQIDDILVQELLNRVSSQWSAKETLQINRRLIEAAFPNVIAACNDWLGIARDEYKWSVTAQINRQDFVKKLNMDIWNYLIQEPVGWLKKNDDNSAWVVDRIQRKKEELKQYKDRTTEINDTLDYAVLSKQPERFVCYAQITLTKPGDSPKKDPDIAVGNTSTEALSAYLAHQLSSDDKLKSIIEDQLEALHLSSGLEKRRLDIGPKFKEARHSKGFKPVSAGHIWTLRPESNQHAGQTVNRSEQVTLPLELAESLNTLNDLQHEYDKARFEIESLRSQLFADWYKYMLCAYPPLDTPDDYPDIDEVKHFIEINYLEDSPLQQKLGKVGELKIGKHDAAGQPTLQFVQPGDLANQIFAALNNLLDSDSMNDLQKVVESDIGDWKGFSEKLKDFPQLKLPAISLDPTDLEVQKKSIAAFLAALNVQTSSRDFYSAFTAQSDSAAASMKLIRKLESVPDSPKRVWLRLNRLLLESLFPQYIAHRPDYILKRVPAPRYWEPNDPVVLLAGNIARPTDRHGPDGELQQDGFLSCAIIMWNTFTFDNTPGLNTVRDAIRMQAGTLGRQTWNEQPWNPILLEWEVEFFPAKYGNNLISKSSLYDPPYINNNYRLGNNKVDFRVGPQNQGVIQAANVYVGRSILTPHAKIQLEAKLQEYLAQFVKENIWDDYQKPSNTDKVAGSPDSFDAGWVLEHLDDLSKWSGKQSKDPANDKDLAQFRNYISAYKQIESPDFHILAQSLGGFDQALLMHKQTHQFPIEDPLGFEEYLNFTKDASQQQPRFDVHTYVGKNNRLAPQPLNNFNPIRAGSMKLLKLRLIDTFGQVREVDCNAMIAAETMPPTEDGVALYPRLAQPARLNFRWLAAETPSGEDDAEMNDHPATSPICGWILPNNLDDSLMIYEASGGALGSLDRNGAWHSAPGRLPISIWDIPNLHLRKLVHNLYEQSQPRKYLFSVGSDLTDELNKKPPSDILRKQFRDHGIVLSSKAAVGVIDAGKNWTISDSPQTYLISSENQALNVYLKQEKFFECFLNAIENALENIDPENFAQHEALALLMGRPIAVVRASLNLELRGRPAINQDWNVFRQDMQATATEKDSQGIDHLMRTTDGFTGVSFPIRIGEFEQLNDGLIGYWVEKEDEYDGGKFYAPQALPDGDPTHEYIQLHEKGKPAMIDGSIDDPPHKLTMLLDPHGVVHATCGILPIKSIQIPPDQFADALRAIEVTFLTAPIITDLGKINLPLPEEPGYQWSWLEKESGVWSEDEKNIAPVNPQATFASKQMIREGWLKLRPRPDQKSS